MIKEYIAYLKDNPEKYWFRAKLYGWGWTPARWQGWLVILVFIGLIVGNVFRFTSMGVARNEMPVELVIETFILVAILTGICWKTGERPRWQWGQKK